MSIILSIVAFFKKNVDKLLEEICVGREIEHQAIKQGVVHATPPVGAHPLPYSERHVLPPLE